MTHEMFFMLNDDIILIHVCQYNVVVQLETYILAPDVCKCEAIANSGRSLNKTMLLVSLFAINVLGGFFFHLSYL